MWLLPGSSALYIKQVNKHTVIFHDAGVQNCSTINVCSFVCAVTTTL